MLLLTSLIVAMGALSLAGPAVPGPGDRARPPDGASAVGIIDVPYLPQTEALCGGAAVAMVFRYWGDRHADVQQFASLVDRRAGGIADDVLIDAVRRRRWQAIRLDATIETLREQLKAGRPVILLLEDRPGRFHYVVAIGADADHLSLHDPAVGPSRRMTNADFLRAWRPSNFWALLVLPGTDSLPSGSVALDRGSEPAVVAGAPNSASEHCDRLTDEALAQIERRGLQAADALLGHVRATCPGASRPVGELAGVRFAERRWGDAARLAEQAVDRDATNAYAWDVLASSRFMQNDLRGALGAWNRVGKPRLDSVRIEGLDRTSHALVAQTLGLIPGTLLLEGQYARAERRLQQMPGHLNARVGLRPGPDGFAVVEVAVVERPARPRGAVEWAAATVEAVVDREIRAAVPGWMGQGEVWTASWRWWSERPRAALTFSAPRLGPLPGIWRVEAAWEAETYGAALDAPKREERTHGGVAFTDWLTANVRYDVRTGLDSWNGSSRTVSLGGTIDRFLIDNRLHVSGAVDAWKPFAGSAFVSTAVEATFRSSVSPRRFVHVLHAGVDSVSRGAPLLLWPGAGEGQARRPLLRAHPLLRSGAIDGPAFGRRVSYATVEAQRWFERPALVRVGLAAFVDVTNAAKRPAGARGGPFHVDGGVGLRMRLPGRSDTLRVDYARGLRDGAHALTVGWQR